jgi:hypothetical protein
VTKYGKRRPILTQTNKCRSGSCFPKGWEGNSIHWLKKTIGPQTPYQKQLVPMPKIGPQTWNPHVQSTTLWKMKMCGTYRYTVEHRYRLLWARNNSELRLPYRKREREAGKVNRSKTARATSSSSSSSLHDIGTNASSGFKSYTIFQRRSLTSASVRSEGYCLFRESVIFRSLYMLKSFMFVFENSIFLRKYL